MITSNIDEILLKNDLNNNFSTNNTPNTEFLDTLINNTQTTDEKKIHSNELTYSNIKGISLEQIDKLFINEEDKQMAKNLRLATLFTDDKHLAQALFNTVLGQPFNLGYNYLSESYEDKHTFFKSNYSNSSLGELLHETITNKDSKSLEKGEKIPQEYLDEILLEVNSFNFLSALSNTSKDQYGRYKDEKDDNYSFLYNDYYLKYQELIQKYEDEKTKEKSFLEQFK